MAGIAFQQLRAATNPGIEGDGGGGTTGGIQVKTSTGLTRTASGVLIDTASTVNFSGAAWSFANAGELSVTGASFSGSQVPNADWVSSQIATGVSWGYPVLDAVQLDGTNDTINQAIVLYFAGQPVVGDTIIISDGTPETWTGVAGGSAANQFSVDTSANAAMTDLANRNTPSPTAFTELGPHLRTHSLWSSGARTTTPTTRPLRWATSTRSPRRSALVRRRRI